MAETGSDTRSGIGARLRAGRERMGLTQLQVAEKLHVDPKVIESLEAERYDALGAPVFVRGYLKRFAEIINEQAFQLLDLYTEATKPAMPDLTKLPKAAHEAKPSQLAVPALLVLIAFVLIGVVWWVLQSVHKSGGSTASAAREVSTEEVVVPDEGGAGGAGGTAISSASSGAAGTGPAATTAQSAPAPDSDSAPARKPMEVTLRFSADSWVEIYDANGEKLFYDIGSAESQRTISGTPPFRVTFANAPGVTFDVNGKPGTIPAEAIHEETAEFVINRSGRIVRVRPRPAGSAQPPGAPSEGR